MRRAAHEDQTATGAHERKRAKQETASSTLRQRPPGALDRIHTGQTTLPKDTS